MASFSRFDGISTCVGHTDTLTDTDHSLHVCHIRVAQRSSAIASVDHIINKFILSFSTLLLSSIFKFFLHLSFP